MRRLGADGIGAVLVVKVLDAPAPSRRRLRRGRPRDADPDDAGSPAPVTLFTVIESEAIEGDASRWLQQVRGDEERTGELVDRGLERVAQALAARRVASADASVPDPTLASAMRIRVGYGNGDALVDGRFEEAVELPRSDRHSTRSAALRPQERTAAILGGREQPLACEELVIRARADLHAGRNREATLQLRVALEALLAEQEALVRPSQADDLALLTERRRAVGEGANEALLGEPASERMAQIAETLSVCERVLRRRAAHG